MEKEISSIVKIRFSDCDPIGHLNNVKYLEYMLNAREDHIEFLFEFNYQDYTQKTGCTWITIQNEIAYLKEVKFGNQVRISSKLIEIGERVSKVEILMTNEDQSIIYAVLWITVIYFNLITRKSEVQPIEIMSFFQNNLVKIEQSTFTDRVLHFRKKI